MPEPSSHPNDPPHRKLVKHYDEAGHAHELTFSCYRRLPLLSNQRLLPLLSQAIDRAMIGQGFELVAFVYMPEHMHLIVWPVLPTAMISKLLFAIKRPFSFRAKEVLKYDAATMDMLTICERPGKEVFRFWQEGGGYDRNIRRIETLNTATEYIHRNPVRRGLCESPGDYRWSSWAFFHEPERAVDPALPKVHGWSDA